jgi:hypothetical protein
LEYQNSLPCLLRQEVESILPEKNIHKFLFLKGFTVMSIRMLWRRRLLFSPLAAFVLIYLAFSANVATVNAATVRNDVQVINWHPASHVSQHLAQAAALTSSKQQKIRSIPHWSSSFTYQGQSYPYTMVGTNPKDGSAITIIPTELIPVKIVLSDGSVYNGEHKVGDILDSPLFRFASFESGYTQYGDAIQRAEFWQYVSTKSSSYHVFLAPPIVFPTLTIHVPANMGAPIKRPSGVVFGGIDINYLDNQLVTYMQTYHISPRTLPIFLSANVLGTDNNGTGCCIGGYHNAIANADNTAIQTYAYATYNDPGFSVKNPKVFTTTDALSHEISEWFNDPFGNNGVPYWSVPSEPQYGCNNALEVGDPLVGVGFDIGKYHLQDETFFSWFAYQVPSIGFKGYYSYLGTFTTPATACTPKK